MFWIISYEQFGSIGAGFPVGPQELDHIGPFETKEEALQRMEELKRHFIISGWTERKQGLYQEGSKSDSDYHFWYMIKQK